MWAFAQARVQSSTRHVCKIRLGTCSRFDQARVPGSPRHVCKVRPGTSAGFDQARAPGPWSRVQRGVTAKHRTPSEHRTKHHAAATHRRAIHGSTRPFMEACVYLWTAVRTSGPCIEGSFSGTPSPPSLPPASALFHLRKTQENRQIRTVTPPSKRVPANARESATIVRTLAEACTQKPEAFTFLQSVQDPNL